MCIFNMSCLNLPVEGPLQACSKAYILRLAGSNPLESGWPGRRQMILATTRRVSRIGGRVQTSSLAFSFSGGDRSSLWWTLRGTFFDSSPRLFVVAIPSLITFGWDVTESRPEEKWRIGLIRFELVHTGKAARVPGLTSTLLFTSLVCWVLTRIRIKPVLIYKIFCLVNCQGILQKGHSVILRFPFRGSAMSNFVRSENALLNWNILQKGHIFLAIIYEGPNSKTRNLKSASSSENFRQVQS